MKDSAFHGLNRTTYLNGVSCRICGDTKKCCYRWTENRVWVYKIMPCHNCCRLDVKKDPDFTDKVMVSDVWVDLPIEDQRARVRERAFSPPPALSAAYGFTFTTSGRLTEQPVQPPLERANEEVENE